MPVDRPEAGTPRGEYCAVINSTDPWWSLTLVPCAITGLLAYALRNRIKALAGATILICALLAFNGGIPHFLTFSHTI